jgi:hypothetical protein
LHTECGKSRTVVKGSDGFDHGRTRLGGGEPASAWVRTDVSGSCTGLEPRSAAAAWPAPVLGTEAFA